MLIIKFLKIYPQRGLLCLILILFYLNFCLFLCNSTVLAEEPAFLLEPLEKFLELNSQGNLLVEDLSQLEAQADVLRLRMQNGYSYLDWPADLVQLEIYEGKIKELKVSIVSIHDELMRMRANSDEEVFLFSLYASGLFILMVIYLLLKR